jgi:hypothetical protein
VWLGLGVAGLAVVLCCGIGIASVVGLVVTGTAALNEQAHSAVENYLQAVGARRYGEAYRQLCRELRERQSQREFTAQVSAQPRVSEYELRRTEVGQDGDAVVPARVTYDNNTIAEINFRVTQEDAEIRFCGPTG